LVSWLLLFSHYSNPVHLPGPFGFRSAAKNDTEQCEDTTDPMWIGWELDLMEGISEKTNRAVPELNALQNDNSVQERR
jgi:hypothetical protein